MSVLLVVSRYYGCAIGKAKQTAKTEMEKMKLADMTCRQLVKEAAKIIYIVHDEVNYALAIVVQRYIIYVTSFNWLFDLTRETNIRCIWAMLNCSTFSIKVIHTLCSITSILRQIIVSCGIFGVQVKDKDFELELSWVCEETNGFHQFVPPQVCYCHFIFIYFAMDKPTGDTCC